MLVGFSWVGDHIGTFNLIVAPVATADANVFGFPDVVTPRFSCNAFSCSMSAFSSSGTSSWMSEIFNGLWKFPNDKLNPESTNGFDDFVPDNTGLKYSGVLGISTLLVDTRLL
jgi:hypothetical protein